MDISQHCISLQYNPFKFCFIKPSLTFNFYISSIRARPSCVGSFSLSGSVAQLGVSLVTTEIRVEPGVHLGSTHFLTTGNLHIKPMTHVVSDG